jgi:hypothetical protein
MSKKLWTGQLVLPVWKQGDDYKELGGPPAEVLPELADHYRSAAEACDKLAEVCEAHPEIEVEGETHWIWVTGPEEVLQALRQEGILIPRMEGEGEDQ